MSDQDAKQALEEIAEGGGIELELEKCAQLIRKLRQDRVFIQPPQKAKKAKAAAQRVIDLDDL